METPQRWYGQGLAFECTSCGRCCTGSHGYVWVTVEEARVLAKRLSLSLDDFGRRYLRRIGNRYALVDGRGGDCVFLAGKVCAVYEDRPMQCRTFPWWPANVASAESWRAAAECCEGIRPEAPVVSAESIEHALDQSRGAGLAVARQT
ncbi:MAG TPA: YkgJ family cysteine cluster protein [Candidatus Limnocylindrales bacterium]|nr:YkgJ family cysteine cluster protein [Candidatus Limnocylindrales bacterium]